LILLQRGYCVNIVPLLNDIDILTSFDERIGDYALTEQESVNGSACNGIYDE